MIISANEDWYFGIAILATNSQYHHAKDINTRIMSRTISWGGPGPLSAAHAISEKPGVEI